MGFGIVRDRGSAVINAAIVIFIVVVTYLILAPMFFRRGCGDARLPACQSNLNQIGKAIKMYCADNDGMLPSSAIAGVKEWDSGNYVRFATKRGDHSVTSPSGATISTVLHGYLGRISESQDEDSFHCPLDRNRDHSPNSTTSYWYKAAVDRAWFGRTDAKGAWSCKHPDDFADTSRQIAFYEHAGSHLTSKRDGIQRRNALFLDGHAKSFTVNVVDNADGKTDPLSPGEPGWFNCDSKNRKSTGKTRCYDGRHYCDYLDGYGKDLMRQAK